LIDGRWEFRSIKRRAFLCFSAAGLVVVLPDVGTGPHRLLAAQSHNPLTRSTVVLRHSFPHLDGTHLSASIVDVRYAPGESSPRHSHPCPLAYVIEEGVRVHIEGQPETIYKAGESFYEAPNGIHELTQNVISTDPARLVAFFVCDHDTPLTIPLDAHEGR
jgi:quercetin dioxygenase-like cupin family protein